MPKNFDRISPPSIPMSNYLQCHCLIIALIAGVASSAASQPAPNQKDLPTIQVSALEIGSLDVPPLYWKQITFDENGDPVESYNRLTISSGSRGDTTDITLLAPTYLYTGNFEPDGEPNMQPAVEIPAEAPGDRFLVVFFHDENGRLLRRVIDDSAESHPAGTVRVINFGKERLVFNAGGENQPVPADGDAVSKPIVNEQGRFPFVYYTSRNNKVFRAPSKLLRLRHTSSRLLVLYANLREANDTGEVNPDGSPVLDISYVPIAYRLYDTISDEN